MLILLVLNSFQKSRTHKNWLIAVQNGNRELLEILDRGMALITDGEKLQINRRWTASVNPGGKTVPVSINGDDPLDASSVGLSNDEAFWLDNHPVIRVGIMNGWPPMDYVDAGGQPQGIGVEFIRAINRRLGNRLEIIPGPWEEIFEAVKNKKLDALMDITPRPDRAAFFHFTKPYIEIPHIIFTRKDEPYKASLDDLSGMTVGVEKNFFIINVLNDRYPNIRIREYTSTSDALDALSKGEVDAFVGNRAVAMYIIENELIFNLKAGGKIIETASVNAIGVRSDWPILCRILQKALDDITPGERSRILQFYPRLNFKKTTEKCFMGKLDTGQRAWLNDHPRISIGVMDAWPPINFVNDDNIISGIGADYIAALNKRLGGRLMMEPAPFKENYEKVKNHQLPALMDITPKEERKPFFNFTRPYLSIPHVYVGRRDGPYFDAAEDLFGRIIALEKGYYNARLFHENYPQVTVREYSSTAEALGAVSRGEADAYAGNRAVVMYLMEKELLYNLVVQGRMKKPSVKLSIGVRKDWPILEDILDIALADITTEEVKKIHKTWIGEFNILELGLTDGEQAWLRDHPIIRVSNEPDWPPYDFTAAGRPTGFAIDYLSLLSEKAGVRFEFVTADWNELMEKFKQGEIDLIHPLQYSKKRESFMLFTKPFFTLSSVAAVRQEDDTITTLKQLYGKTLAAGKGWVLTDYIRRKHPLIRLLIVPNALEGLKSVHLGSADAWIDAYSTSRFLMDSHHLTNLKLGSEIMDAGDFRFVNYYIGVRKDWPLLRDILQKALDSVSLDETQLLNEKWRVFAEKVQRLKLTEEEQEWLAAKPVLRIGYDVDRPPVEFGGKDGTHKGMSADYMAMIAESLGVTIKFGETKSWQATVNAAKKGEVDLLSAASPTSQLYGYFNFTRPYLSFPIVIVTDQTVAYINDMKELAGKTVAVVSGGGAHDILANTHPEIVLQPVESITKGLKAVQKNDAYAFVDSLASISHIMGREGITGLKVTGQTPYNCDITVGVSKDQPVLAGLVQKALDAIDEGQRTEIFNRWIAVAYERGINYTLVWEILAVVLVILLAFTYWNRSLSREVNKRRLAQEALLESEERFRTTFEQAPIGIVTMMRDGRFLSVNTCFSEMLGHSLDELKELSMKDIIRPEDRAKLQDAMEQLSEKAMRLVMKKSYLRKNGTKMDGRTTMVSLLDGAGRVYAVLATVEDVTAEKRAQAEIQQAKEAAEESNRNLVHSQERLALALKGGDLGFWDVNLVTGEMVVNQRWMEMLGYPNDALDHLTRDRWLQALHPDDRDRVLRMGKDYQKGWVDTYEVEYRIITRSGDIRWQFSKGEVVERGEKNGVLRMVGTVMDITSRREAEEKLRQYMDELERFNRLAVGREKQIISLKQAINSLLEKLGQEPKYRSVE